MSLRAPFPWFGGKSRAAPIVWERFGDVANYVEPFAGSLAVLLARPSLPRTETINDLDCHVANFWRAVQADPDSVAKWSDWPVNEADLHARHLWLVQGLPAHRERMMTEPDYFDAKIAGWWVWGLCAWIGTGWCAPRDGVSRSLPSIARSSGVHRKLTASSMHLAGNAKDESVPFGSLSEWIQALMIRLRRTQVCCGDWMRVLGTGGLTGCLNSYPGGSMVGVFLDPPYQDGNMEYAEASTGISQRVASWAIQNGDDARIRIALCGYEGEHLMPPSWECVPWKAKGGYARGNKANAKRERIWFSPHCLGGDQQKLF